jgi:hypothetical protein
MVVVSDRGEPRMEVSRYPCRACGRATEGEDTYVICWQCLDELESRSNERSWGPGDPASNAADGSPPEARTPDEIEVSLRRLLDDW